VSYLTGIFKRERWRVLALPVVVGALAGCGGDDPDRLSREEWIASADSICADANQELDALPDPTTPAELAEFTARAVEIAERQLDRLRDLRPPDDAEDDYATMLDLTEEQIGVVRTISEEAESGAPGSIDELLEEGRALDDQVAALAADYGFQECGRD
jgi:hypothetical protein